jgi:hypothetical protein
MEHRPRQQDVEKATPDDAEPEVRAHETRPGRTVFTEDGNSDGWIATDLAVEPER